MSWSPEVIADSSGKFVGNALRFETKEEAEANVRDLMMRWFAVRETRVVETTDPVTYKWTDKGLVKFDPALDCACGGTGIVPDPHTEDGFAPCPVCEEGAKRKVGA